MKKRKKKKGNRSPHPIKKLKNRKFYKRNDIKIPIKLISKC
jgi:hypothetical protein